MKKFASVSLRATLTNVRKTSKNVRLPLLILTAKFVQNRRGTLSTQSLCGRLAEEHFQLNAAYNRRCIKIHTLAECFW